jgi:hypothetical protein
MYNGYIISPQDFILRYNLTILKGVCAAERNGGRKLDPRRKLFWMGGGVCWEGVGKSSGWRGVGKGMGGWSASFGGEAGSVPGGR